jgi:hypothetical protein
MTATGVTKQPAPPHPLPLFPCLPNQRRATSRYTRPDHRLRVSLYLACYPL